MLSDVKVMSGVLYKQCKCYWSGNKWMPTALRKYDHTTQIISPHNLDNTYLVYGNYATSRYFSSCLESSCIGLWAHSSTSLRNKITIIYNRITGITTIGLDFLSFPWNCFILGTTSLAVGEVKVTKGQSYKNNLIKSTTNSDLARLFGYWFMLCSCNVSWSDIASSFTTVWMESKDG